MAARLGNEMQTTSLARLRENYILQHVLDLIDFGNGKLPKDEYKIMLCQQIWRYSSTSRARPARQEWLGTHPNSHSMKHEVRSTNMPVISRKRRSTGKIYETVPNFNQAYLPAPRQKIGKNPPTWSAPRKYQQTITQMNPFYTIYHPESEDEALQTDEEEEPSYVASPVGRKRRRITPEAEEPEEPFNQKMKTRSSARKAVKTEPQLQAKAEEVELPSNMEGDKTSKPHPAATLMPPPVTPRTWRKREIPSSQSPADSPLSTQSRRSARGYSRSPLKERSTNYTLPAPSTRKGVLWKRKLKVEDSLENEEEDSPICTRLRPSTETMLPKTAPESLVENDGTHLPANEIVTGWRSSGEVAESSQRRDLEANLSSPVEDATKDICDSDFDYDCDCEDPGNESIELVQGHVPSPVQPNMSANMSKHDTPNTTGSTPEGRSCSDNPAALDESTEDDIHTLHKQRSESEEASAQLFNDLQRATQPGGLQTESQYENAWSPYHPADAALDTPDNTNTPSSPLIEAEEPYSMPAPMTVPTQILPPPTPPVQHPVPPSQATTTDVTQPSPRKVPSLSSLAFPSSTPPMPPTLSSPSESRKAPDPWKEFKWNGVRLTDSQLLPESLMHDSYLGPPSGLDLSQDDLEE